MKDRTGRKPWLRFCVLLLAALALQGIPALFLLMALCLALGRKGWTGQGSTGPCSGQNHASHGERDGRDCRHSLSGRQALLIAWAAGTSYGILDEIHQIFVNGRGCQVSDMCFDSFGVLLGCVIALGIRQIVRRS